MTLGTDVFLCASKTCRLCELMQRGKHQEGNAVKVLGLFFWGGLVGWFFFLDDEGNGSMGVDRIC